MSSKEETLRVLGELKMECERYKNESLLNPVDDGSEGWCEIVWDNVMCWNKTRPGTKARLPCPGYITHFNTAEFAEKVCTENGSWWVNPIHGSFWTNYSNCVIPSSDIRSHAAQADNLILLYTIGYSISLASLVVAVVIMLYWRRLHCKSNTLHINLFIAFILRASVSFMKDRLFVGGLGLPGDVRKGERGLVFIEEGVHWECRTLFVLLMYAISASQTWMLMEGLYLYLLIHKTMTTERLGVRPYIVLGWALPWAFLIPWIVVKVNYENTFCWNLQKNTAYFWIMKGPWTAVVVINFIFFLHIIRALVTRVRNNQRHAGRSQYRKFGKFILVLIPLFGIMYIVLNVAFPSEVHGSEYNLVYLYIEMGYNSFQGFILALLFCFLNEDVHSEMRRSWQRHRSRRYNSNIFKRSVAQSSWHGGSRSSATNSPVVRRGLTSSGNKAKNTTAHNQSSRRQNYDTTTSQYTTTNNDITVYMHGNRSVSNLSANGSGNHDSQDAKHNGTKCPVTTSLVSKGRVGRSNENRYEVEVNTTTDVSRPLKSSYE